MIGNNVPTRESGEFLPIDEVFDRNLDLLEIVQYVKLGEVEGIVAIDEARVLQYDKVKPTATPTPSGSNAELASNFLEVNSNILWNTT